MNGLSNPRFEDNTLVADCDGRPVNCAMLMQSTRRRGLVRLVDAVEGVCFATFAQDRLPDADYALRLYVAWQNEA